MNLLVVEVLLVPVEGMLLFIELNSIYYYNCNYNYIDQFISLVHFIIVTISIYLYLPLYVTPSSRTITISIFPSPYILTLYSCSFSQVTETLQAGYCHGGNCDVDGASHPSLNEYLSV